MSKGPFRIAAMLFTSLWATSLSPQEIEIVHINVGQGDSASTK
jgi:beta-lactamase superfamily II metal-dependent hydrolase